MENLVGYAKRDLLVPQAPFADLAAANTAARAWCEEVNAAEHSEIATVPAQRLTSEAALLRSLPSLRLVMGTVTTRKVDRLSCVRFGSARYSVPTTAIGSVVELRSGEGGLRVVDITTGALLAEHRLVVPGEASVLDAHYGAPRPSTPRRTVRPKSAVEKQFCALGPVAEAFLIGAAAAGHTRLGSELGELLGLGLAHGADALLPALTRATAFGRWRAADVRSILAAGAGAPEPRPAGDALILELPVVPTRSLAAYAISPTTSPASDTGATDGEVVS